MFKRLSDPLTFHDCNRLCGILSEESHAVEIWSDTDIDERRITKYMFEEGYKVLLARQEPDLRPPTEGRRGYDYVEKDFTFRHREYTIGWMVTIEEISDG